MEFKARKDRKMGLVIFFTTALCLGTVVLTFLLPRVFIASDIAGIVLVVLSGMLVWVWVDTSYRIELGVFYYRSGPFKGKILISAINQVSRNRTLTVGKKPALAAGGMVITFNKYEELYIAPVDKEGLIKELTTVNPGIVVI